MTSTGNHAPKSQSTLGFTLIELMIAIAVLAILVTVALPSFRTVIEGNRAATLANEVITALSYARAEAIRRGAPVTLCASADQASCANSTDWAAGWILVDESNVLIRTWSQIPDSVTLTGPANLVFVGNGTLNQAPLQDFCLTVSAAQSRIIEVNRVGRARVEAATC
ncbi:MAG: GspH/FimT family pseudopilin [Gammaproteobacteria bacterium]|nr:GspH/FimT family pseudopilin [Gammaproteobacteria bacterium]TVQ43867.1 MAG: prepilin-type N-terminal cleavage/methylation domain-containing protein [Gammaproteobacteria bacterium]